MSFIVMLIIYTSVQVFFFLHRYRLLSQLQEKKCPLEILSKLKIKHIVQFPPKIFWKENTWKWNNANSTKAKNHLGFQWV